jgi:hypothetical protein
MHFLMRLVTCLLPVQNMVLGENQDMPVGFDRVITNTGNYVVTVRNNFVIAKT